MAIRNQQELKNYFQTGDIPTESQYADLIDSLLHQSDPRLLKLIENIEIKNGYLQLKAGNGDLVAQISLADLGIQMSESSLFIQQLQSALDMVTTEQLNEAIAAASSGMKYTWANAAARNAQTGMMEHEQGVQQDTREVYRYDGINWVFLYALDGDHNHDDRYKRQYAQTITVNGDADKYYQVVFKGGNQNRIRELNIYRNYSQTAPDTWNTPTHKGGLTAEFRLNMGGWGGAQYDWKLLDFRESYSTMLADAGNTSHNKAFYVMLRGGGAEYNIDSDDVLNIQIAYSSSEIIYNHTNPTYVVYGKEPLTEINSTNLLNHSIPVNADVLLKNEKATDSDKLDGIDGSEFVRYGTGSYSLLLGKNGSDSDWLRTTKNGLIPYQNGGHGSLGTSSWNFNTIYGKTLYENNVALSNKYLEKTAKAVDSDKLDGLNSTQFLRSDADDTFVGKLSLGSTTMRQGGIYGTYDSKKTGHIWSMGIAYKIAADGSTFGNLYGFGYKHTNNATGGTMASGHQAVWCQNGTPHVALGTNIWTKGDVKATRDIYASGTYYYGDNKRIVQFSDSWLRLNPSNQFTSGIYCAQSTLRTDNQLQVGSGGSAFYANSSGDGRFNRNLTVNGNIYGKAVNGTYSNLYRFGGLYLTWDSDSYGANKHHSIRSTYGDTYGDAITINSFNHIRLNIDSNNNNKGSRFEIGANNTGTSNVVFSVDDTGTLTAKGDVIAYSTSDMRFKDEIQPIANPLTKINQLSGNEFKWNEKQEIYKKGSKDYGILAQEIANVLPEAVRENDDTGYLSVRYEKLIPLLIEGIKEQQYQIEELKTKIHGINN